MHGAAGGILPASRDDRGNLAQPGWSIRVIDGREHPPAIVPDGPREGGAGRLLRRESIILSSPRIAALPFRGAHRAQPLRGYDGKTIESVPHRFADHLDPVQGPHGRQHMGGVGALAAPGLAQVAVAAPCKQRVEEQILRRSGNESGAKFTQDRGIEPRIRELQA
jgi:hypothetical protein